MNAPISGGAEFFDKVSEPLKGFLVDQARQPHSHLRAVVATEHRAVVDQGNFAPEPRRTHRRGAAGDPAANHHEVILTSVQRMLRVTAQLPTECAEHCDVIGRRRRRIGRQEKQRIAPPSEPGEIAQRKGHLLLCDFDHAAVLPMPRAALLTEDWGQFLAVQNDAEDTR